MSEEEWERREKNKVKREEREENKKGLKLIPHRFRTVANLQRYYSHVVKMMRFSPSDIWCFFCLVWQMCQIFGIWHICHTYYGCSKDWLQKIVSVLILKIFKMVEFNISLWCALLSWVSVVTFFFSLDWGSMLWVMDSRNNVIGSYESVVH